MEGRGIRINMDIFAARSCGNGSLREKNLVARGIAGLSRVFKEAGLIENEVTAGKTYNELLTSALKHLRHLIPCIRFRRFFRTHPSQVIIWLGDAGRPAENATARAALITDWDGNLVDAMVSRKSRAAAAVRKICLWSP